MGKISFRPKGTCSQVMNVDVQDGVIRGVEILGGCNGNLQGISRLVTGMPAQAAIEKLRGIRCGFKPTSCPDQLSYAIEKAMQEK